MFLYTIYTNEIKFKPKKIFRCQKIYFEISQFKINGVKMKLEIGDTVELQWLEYLWSHENMFETGVVQANEY